jgi:hypothetical protein
MQFNGFIKYLPLKSKIRRLHCRPWNAVLDFSSANPSIVRSVKQRDLLNAWLRVFNRRGTLPRREDYRPERVTDELPDMMGFDVIGQGDHARFLITQEGSRLTATYGNEHVDPDKRTNRYLDDAIGPQRYARMLPSYLACVAHRRPTYSVAMVQDADGKDVSYERLVLPFGSADAVEQIVGSYKAISIEGGFKIRDLMGVSSKPVPESVIKAVIDQTMSVSMSRHAAADDLVELD